MDMKLAFSTLGCPRWSLTEIAQSARAYGYEAVELRALDGRLDLLARSEFQPENIAQTRAFFAARGLRVCSVDTSCSFHAIAEAERREHIAVAARHAALAAALDAPLVRVFPNEIPASATRTETRARIVASLQELAARMPA